MAVKEYLERRRASRNAHVIGLCRFSYPALGGFKTEHESPEQRAAFLYAPERLDERFRLFETFTLPSLRTQTDQDFIFLVVVGEDFPPERMEQLRAITADIEQVVIVPRAPGRHREVMKEVIDEYRVPGSYSIQFRLDDDDAIGVGFVHKCRRILDQNFMLFEGSRHVAIDFTRGWNARPTAKGIRAERQKALYLGVSFAIAFRPDTDLCVMNFTHHEVWQHMPTITRTDPDMWIRGVNDHNDSRDRIGTKLRYLTPEEESKFEKAFGITQEHVQSVYRDVADGS